MGKCVMQVTKPDVIDESGSLQMCAGHKSDSEAAIHAMRNIFDADTTDAVLLVDASNAFNSQNRAAALHNIEVLCPSLATYVINTYRRPARLFIKGGEEITSAEGTTQGDPIAMSLYALSLQPLITQRYMSLQKQNSAGSLTMQLELVSFKTSEYGGTSYQIMVLPLVIFQRRKNVGWSSNLTENKLP